MSLKQELKNPKSYLIRRVHKDRTFSVNLPKEICERANIQDKDHLMIYSDDLNHIIFLKKLEIEV